MQLVGLPEGVNFVCVSSEPGQGYTWQAGSISGSPTHPFGPGSIVIEPAVGYEFFYDVMSDCVGISRKLAPPKVVTAEFRVTNERDLERLLTGLPRAKGFVSIREE